MASMEIKVRAIAGARKEGVEEMSPGYYRVKVSVPPENGRANERIRELLSGHLDVPKSHISLKRGSASKEKSFSVDIG